MMQDYQNELALIREALRKNPLGMSVTEIAKVLGKSKNTIGRYLDILLITGQVDMRAYGMAKVFTLSQRMPLSAMLSYANELIMVVDEELRIVDINENFLNLLHISREETIGKNLVYIRTPDVDVRELLETITEDRDTSAPVTLHVKEKGERIFTRKKIPVVFDDGSKGTTIILEDMTAHILAEREIRESEERFRMMAENIWDGIIILEHDTVVFANRRLAEITGYTLGELQSMDTLAIFVPEDQAKIKKKFHDDDLHAPQPCDILVRIIRKDGAHRFVYIRKTVLQAEKTFQFIIMTDVTDIKSKETELAMSEERFRMMAENIQDGLIIVEQGRIVFANRRISEITGYSDEELKEMGIYTSHTGQNGRKQPEQPGKRKGMQDGMKAGGKIPRIIPEEEHEMIEKIIHDAKPDSEAPVEFKVWIVRKDGTRMFTHGKVTAASHDGLVSTYIIITDITEFAKREKILQERIEILQRLIK
jgi:PAS domain S-box-containing protein